jgi:hypothetical protein
MAIPENLARLHTGEDVLRSKSLEAIEASPDLSAHVEMIEAAMDALDYFARSYQASSENEKTIQLLYIRLFNATASAFKLAMSGYYQNSALIQRDMLETIFLLDYFRTDDSLIQQWQTADKATRLKKFKPAAIREALDKRDGFTAKKRSAAYDLLSELAGHATYNGFRMLTPVAGGNAHCGPFFETTSLDAVLSELAKHCVQTFLRPRKYFSPKKKEDLKAYIHIVESQRAWTNKFFETMPDNDDILKLKGLLQKWDEDDDIRRRNQSQTRKAHGAS